MYRHHLLIVVFSTHAVNLPPDVSKSAPSIITLAPPHRSHNFHTLSIVDGIKNVYWYVVMGYSPVIPFHLRFYFVLMLIIYFGHSVLLAFIDKRRMVHFIVQWHFHCYLFLTKIFRLMEFLHHRNIYILMVCSLLDVLLSPSHDDDDAGWPCGGGWWQRLWCPKCPIMLEVQCLPSIHYIIKRSIISATN